MYHTVTSSTSRVTPNSSGGRESGRVRRRREDEKDAMMTDEDESNSVATTMGVKADNHGLLVVPPPRDLDSVNGSVTGNSLILPKPLISHGEDENDDGDMMEDDDISTLTEYSMEEEDDNVSQATQNTAWTVITTGTDSTTIPTRNFPSVGENNHPQVTKPRTMKGKRNLMKDGALTSNSQFKRRRMA